jgi:hypothetical protein
MMIALKIGRFIPECEKISLLAWRLIPRPRLCLREASDFAWQARSLHTAGPSTRGEPMKVVVATNTLRPLGDGKTSALNLRDAAPNRAGETGAAAM